MKTTPHRPLIHGLPSLLAVFTLLLSLPMSTLAQNRAPEPPDPYLWLEDVQGEKALQWVRERNRASESELQGRPDFPSTREALRQVLDARDRIPAVSRLGAWFYNFWQDAQNPRGIWRRATLEEYRKPQPAWEVVLDLDALGKAEGKSWVWAGADCLGPSHRRCLLRLSPGGSDAAVMREFDTVDRRFVEDGFRLPQAKSRHTWLDEDTLLVATDIGPGSLTDSGYPRVVQRWKRGTPLSQAQTVYEARPSDVWAFLGVDHTPGHKRVVVGRGMDFYRSESFVLEGDRLSRIDKPDDASVRFWKDRALIRLRSAWKTPTQEWAQGSLLVTPAKALLEGKPVLQALFTPTPQRSLSSFATTQSSVLLSVLQDVGSRLEIRRPEAGSSAWLSQTVDLPPNGTLSVSALHDPWMVQDPLAEHYLIAYTDFLTPDSLLLARTDGGAPEKLKSRELQFDAQGMRIEQRFASSKDGTRIPYFIVWPRGAKADGANPTLLYGYGGFDVSMRPSYSGGIGRAWLSRGGVYVLANIRGGGEYGPGWHQSAIRAHKQRSYDDFAAVAEDLIKTGVTQPRHLGIRGGSNGGLLVGAVMLQRPELFNAVVCQVPLLDMRRFHRLLAGASWMAEYGDPDNPQEWAWISGYSPYQNVPPARGEGARSLPAVLFVTSTQDDRVHPGHARKMAARMSERGHEVVYWENTEGGHGGAADNGQRAQMQALEYSFLWRQLGGR